MRKRKLISLLAAAALVLGAVSVPAYAADTKYVDGSYTGTATVEDEFDSFETGDYDITVAVKVENGVVASVGYAEGTVFDETNASYANRAMNGRHTATTNIPGMAEKIVAANGTEGVDAVSNATCSSHAIIKAVNAALEGHAAEEPIDSSAYVLMNIPYSDFYKGEGIEAVDAVTSATLNKTRNNLSAGSYHVNADGSDITGVIYPVYVEDLASLAGYKQITDEDTVEITVTNRGTTTTTEYKGSDALFEAPSYSYYVLSEAPAYYKELTVNEDGSLFFGQSKGERTERAASAELQAGPETRYGDYQLNISGLTDEGETIDKIFGVVIHTAEGDSYAMRHLENIWRQTNIAWSIGYTTESHGSPMSYRYYTGSQGQTVTSVTYFTSSGIRELKLTEAVKLPLFAEISAEMADKQTINVSGIPADAQNVTAALYYTVGSGRQAQRVDVEVTFENGTIKLTEGELMPDTVYTVAISSDNYVTMTASISYTELKKGDVTMDNIIDNADLVTLARYTVKLEQFTDKQAELADFDNSGEIDNSDLVSLARLIVGL